MPIITDNSFSRDSYSTRAERLIAIQSNFDSVQPDLNAPANIVAWAEDCHDVFSALWAEANAEEGESKGATLDSQEKGAAMDDAYQRAKTIAETLYRDDEKNFDEFKFDLPYPIKRNDRVARVDTVLNAHAHHIEKGITHLIPANIISQLEDTRADFVESIGEQDAERSDAYVATANLQERFKDDTRLLQDLRNWWYTMMGKNDPRITLIGMVNPDVGGGGGSDTPVPAAPTNLVYNPAVPNFTWDPVAGATSYEFQHKTDAATEWNIIYTGPDTTLLHADPVGDYVARVRGRNDGGFGEFSTELEYSVGGPSA